MRWQLSLIFRIYSSQPCPNDGIKAILGLKHIPAVNMLSLLFLATATVGQAFPLLAVRQGITALSISQIDFYNPYTWFASAAYCTPSTTSKWSCGCRFSNILIFVESGVNPYLIADCQANPGFAPIASGGDSTIIQYCMIATHSFPSLKVDNKPHQGMLVMTQVWTLSSLLTKGPTPPKCMCFHYDQTTQLFTQLVALHRLPLITDSDFFLTTLDSSLFPGIPSDIEVHDGFKDAQAA